MITRVKIGNFKSLRRMDVETRGLTLLYGLNGSGKSSFLQALLFFGRNPIQGNNVSRLNDEYLQLGRQRDVFYCYEALRGAMMYAEFMSQSGGVMTSRYRLSDFDLDTVPLEGVSCGGDYTEMHKSLMNMQYISAARPEPMAQPHYESAAREVRSWGRQGQNALSYLFEHGDDTFVDTKLLHDGNEDVEHRSLRTQVNAWLSDISPGAAIHLSRKKGADNLDVSVSFQPGNSAIRFRPENVGFGISIALPLIVMLLSAKPGEVLLIENPEAHLHPGGQSKLGKLLAKAVSAGIQLFVETHSDHIINGVRVAIKEQLIASEAVNVIFFDRKQSSDGVAEGVLPEQYSDWKELHIDSHGEFDEYPADFMDEWNRQVVKLWR